jgi:hypothetical protein
MQQGVNQWDGVRHNQSSDQNVKESLNQLAELLDVALE